MKPAEEQRLVVATITWNREHGHHFREIAKSTSGRGGEEVSPHSSFTPLSTIFSVRFWAYQYFTNGFIPR